MQRHTFSKDQHIRKKNEFEHVFSAQKKAENNIVRLFFSKPFTSKGRVAFIASKKAGSAVVRNRCKRLLREYYRKHPLTFLNIDVILSAKHNLAQCTYSDVEKKMNQLINHLQNTESLWLNPSSF